MTKFGSWVSEETDAGGASAGDGESVSDTIGGIVLIVPVDGRYMDVVEDARRSSNGEVSGAAIA